MTDAELSLAVAKVIWPEFDWYKNDDHVARGIIDNNSICLFDYRTDDAGFKMVRWLAKNCTHTNCDLNLADALRDKNPNKELADMILECVK